MTENYFYVEDYGAVGDDTTDDSVAINDAVAACMTAGGGWIAHRHAAYYVGNTLLDTSVLNALIVIPQNAVSGSNPPVSIGFLGNGPTGQWNHGTVGGWGPGRSGTTYRTDWAGTITGQPAVIAASKYDAGYPAASFNWLEVVIRDLEIRCPADPKLSGLQFAGVASLDLQNVTVATDAISSTMSAPSHSTASGVVMPLRINANPPNRLDNVFVDGFYTGFKVSEVVFGTTISPHHCTVGIEFAGPQDHASHFGRILCVANKTSLKFTGGNYYLTIEQFDVEHKNDGTFGRVYDVNDASNYGKGFIWWHSVMYGSGADNNLNLTGGSGLKFISISSDSIGSGGSGAPTTADYLVGTAQSGLSAEIVVGATPGGELGGTWASPTVDATHAGSVHLALGSSSSTAAAGNHTHAGGSGGVELLTSDAAGSPVVFTDILQNEAQTDLIYQG